MHPCIPLCTACLVLRFQCGAPSLFDLTHAVWQDNLMQHTLASHMECMCLWQMYAVHLHLGIRNVMRMPVVGHTRPPTAAAHAASAAHLTEQVGAHAVRCIDTGASASASARGSFKC